MILTESPIEFWYRSQWVIALASSIATILLTLTAQGVVNYFRRRKARREMARNLSIEILTNDHNNFRYLKSIREVRDTFQTIRKLNSGEFSNYPNLVATGKESTTRFFDYYRNQLNLFEIKLMIDIYGFYEHHLSSVGSGAKKLQIAFEKFYSCNPMVSHSDILAALDEHISNIEVLHKSGEELLATLTFSDKKLREISKEKEFIIKEALKKVRSHIVSLKPGDILKIDDLVNIIEVDGKRIHSIVLMVEVVRAIKKNSLERLRPGEYRRVFKGRKNRDVPAF